jgi:small nuclear ribonucleoprotein (snRNP)-like protein
MVESERFNRENRIGIDIDSKNILSMQRKYYNLKRITNEVQIYETKHGYHILGRFINVDPLVNLHLRRCIGDCDGRMELDEKRISVGLDPSLIDVLFSLKNNKGEIGVEEKFNIDSLPFWGNGEKWVKRKSVKK